MKKCLEKIMDPESQHVVKYSRLDQVLFTRKNDMKLSLIARRSTLESEINSQLSRIYESRYY